MHWIGQKTHPEGSNTGKDGGDTLEDEEPTPTSNTTDTVHVGDSKGNDTGESTSDTGTRVDESPARSALVLAVPEAKVEDDAGSETALKETKEDTAGDERSEVESSTHESSADTPGNTDTGHLDGGLDTGEEKVGGKLSEHVAL